MLDDIRRSAALPKSVLEFSKLLWEMSEESVAKFISGIASTPGDLTPFEGSGRPTVPSWQDSMMVLPVPGAWFFEETEKGFGMNHRNSWSTPLTLLNKAVLRDGREDEQSIRVRWFLNASRDPGGLWECIEDLQNLSDQDAGLAIVG